MGYCILPFRMHVALHIYPYRYVYTIVRICRCVHIVRTCRYVYTIVSKELAVDAMPLHIPIPPLVYTP